MISFGMNSMGAHFNPVSLSIVNSESRLALESTYNATCAGRHLLYNQAGLFLEASCGFCTQLEEQMTSTSGHWRNHLKSHGVNEGHFELDKPSSDKCAAFHSFAKETFGPDVSVQQCCQHLTGASHFLNTFQNTFLKTYLKPFLKSFVCWCAQLLHGPKKFRKYLDNLENYEQLHQFADKFLKASTMAITRLLQVDIVQWLESVGLRWRASRCCLV